MYAIIHVGVCVCDRTSIVIPISRISFGWSLQSFTGKMETLKRPPDRCLIVNIMLKFRRGRASNEVHTDALNLYVYM